MRKILPAERTVVNIQTAAFTPYVADGKPVPGQSYIQLDRSFPEGAGFTIYRMDPGSASQPHEHSCPELFLVLEGEVVDNDGTVYRKGDFVMLAPGTQHSSHTRTGATLAVFVNDLEKNL